MQLEVAGGPVLSPRVCRSYRFQNFWEPALKGTGTLQNAGGTIRVLGLRSQSRRGKFLVSAAKREGTSKEERQSKARSAKALPVRIVTVAKSGAGPAQAVAKSYVEKIRRYCTVEDLVIRPNPKNTPDADVQVASEGERVLKSITPRDYVVVLDERGRDLTSEQLADLVADAGDTGCSSLVFCIGGPYGHGAAVRSRANALVRLSSMVLNHEVALIVLLEQIYRAWSILKGEKYHH